VPPEVLLETTPEVLLETTPAFDFLNQVAIYQGPPDN
jgi:hypothetical protein